MTTFQKTIKYTAFTFAICLAVFIISTIAEAVIGVIDGISGSSDEEITDSYTYETVNELDIEMGVGDLTIRTEGNKFVVNANRLFGFSIRNDNGSLKIKTAAGNFFSGSSDRSLEIIVPEGFMLDDLKVDLGAGECRIDNVSAKSSDFDTGAGSLKCLNFYSRKCKVDCGVGDIEFSFAGLADDYSIVLDKGIGSAEIDGESYSEDKHKNSRAENKIDVDCGIGDVDISFTGQPLP